MSPRKSSSFMKLIVDNTVQTATSDESSPLVRIEVVQRHGEDVWAVLVTGRVLCLCGDVITVAAEEVEGLGTPDDGLSWLIGIPLAQVCDMWRLDPSAVAAEAI